MTFGLLAADGGSTISRDSGILCFGGLYSSNSINSGV